MKLLSSYPVAPAFSMPVFNQSRSRIIRLIFLGAFVVIAGQLFYLQVVSGKYKKLAMDNAVFPKIIFPERGIIYDRKGKAILNNTIIYDFHDQFLHFIFFSR